MSNLTTFGIWQSPPQTLSLLEKKKNNNNNSSKYNNFLYDKVIIRTPIKAIMVLAIVTAMQLIMLIAIGIGQDQGPDKTLIHINLLQLLLLPFQLLPLLLLPVAISYFSTTTTLQVGMGIVWVFSDTGAKPVLLKRYRCLNGAWTDTFFLNAQWGH